MELRRLSEHVWACEQLPTGLGFSNSALVARGGGVVVDTLYDDRLTREMAGLYAGVHPDAPRRVVNTHHDGDHCAHRTSLPAHNAAPARSPSTTAA